MVSRGMLTLCAEINSVHWRLARFHRKNNVFAYNAKTGAVTAQLMIATKSIRTLKPSPVPVHPGLSPDPTWAETPKTCFLASGLNNDLFVHICVNEGADQLRGNHTGRAADQHFCGRIIGSIPLCTFRVGTAFA